MDIQKKCSHSYTTLFCDVCNKVSEFEYDEQNILKNTMEVCLDENLGFSGGAVMKQKDKKLKEVTKQDSFQLFAAIIENIPSEVLKEEDLDLVICKELDKRNMPLDMSNYLVLKQLALRKMKKKGKSQPGVSSYVEWVKAASPSFKSFIEDIFKESNIFIYNLSKTLSDSLTGISDFKKKIVLNCNVDFNLLNLNAHPLTVALFFTRIKGLDLQVVYGLGQRLISNLMTGNFNFYQQNNQNDFHLLFSKLGVCESQQIKTLKEFEEIEIAKIIFANANRGDIMNVRCGNFFAQSAVGKIYDFGCHDFCEEYIRLMDISPLIYKNQHYTLIKIRIEAITGTGKEPTSILNTHFKEHLGGSSIELISTLGAVGDSSLFQHINDNIINNGFIIYKVDRSKVSKGFMFPKPFFGGGVGLLGDDITDSSQYLDTTPVDMPLELKFSSVKSVYKLHSVLGYYENNNKKVPGLYYTVIFTPDGNLFYYSNEFLLFSDTLPHFVKGGSGTRGEHCKRYFDAEDFYVKDECISDVMEFIQRTGFLYIYNSAGYEYQMFHTYA